MKRDRINNELIKFSKAIFILSLFLFVIIGFRVVNLSLSDTVNGVDLKKFASNRNTQKEILVANRGTIYNADGEPLAQTVNSYTVIAFLDARRSEGSRSPKHVVDKEMTAEALAPILNMSVERILGLLNRENVYQVELGPGGKDISELKKEAIEKMQLSGISFTKSYKRYYPNNDFLSYTLGYVQKYDSTLVGEMGIESYFDDILKGIDGYLEYQRDLNGFKIPNTPEIRKNEIDGMDIYLTIDSNIQMFVERVVKNTTTTYNPDWMIMVVADAKTGRILGTSSSPSFNPNTKNITSYLNPLVSYSFEPGSTMKIYTYMAAIEKGTYKGNDTFMSGNKKIGEDTIYDWNRQGWGNISYDLGFTLSSNVGVANMMEKFINRHDLNDYFRLLGFGQKTNITLPSEISGKIDFRYPIEIANAGFGQGITTNAIQHIQAVSAIANDGIMLKPYIVDKIVDSNTGNIVFQGEREEIRRVAQSETIEKIKELMFDAVNGEVRNITGALYRIEGYDIIGKTGTAQYVNPTTGRYAQGEHEYIRSFLGMFPKNNPEVIVYTVVKRPSFGRGQSSVVATKKVIDDVAKYLNIFPTINNENNALIINYDMPNLLNKTTEDAIEILSKYSDKVIVIGDGDKVVNQYPSANMNINNKDKVFIVTNNNTLIMPYIINWSSRDIITYCNLTSLDCELEGYGYAYYQSIGANTLIDDDAVLNVKLKTNLE
jgi:penicillin-binding protein 2B